MDNKNWRAAQEQVQIPGQVMSGDAVANPGMEGGDWRTQLQPDTRQRIVNKIMEYLKRRLPFSGQEGLQELHKTAIKFEEKIYNAAKSQQDYLRRISLKMLSMETKSQNPIANSLQPAAASNIRNPQDPAFQNIQSQIENQLQLISQNIQNNISSTVVPNSAGLTSTLATVGGMSQGTMSNGCGQNPKMHNMANVTGNAVGNSSGQGGPSNMNAKSNPQRQQIQGTRQPQVMTREPQQQSQNSQQYLCNQQLQQQLMKQKIQQVRIPGQVMSGDVVANPDMEGGDWRTQLHSDSRRRIVNKIMEYLERHLPFSGQEGLQELKKIAIKFEEKVYAAATSQQDYLRKISLKMLAMETKSQIPIANSLQSDAASSCRNPQDPENGRT